jgi:hypothetical protein
VALGWGIVVVLVADAGPGSKEYMHGLASHPTLELHSAALQLCTAQRGYMVDSTGTHGAERAAGLAPIPNGVGLLKAITGTRSILVQAALLRVCDRDAVRFYLRHGIGRRVLESTAWAR